MKDRIPTLIINGPVGVGKSSVANLISDKFDSQKIKHAVIDMDYLRHVYPRPDHDPFHEEMGYKNLSDIWRNYKDLGTDKLIIISVVEDKSGLDKYQAAVPGADIVVVRLRGELKTLENNLKKREIGQSLQSHLDLAKAQVDKFEKIKIEDFVVDVDGKTIEQLAKEVLIKSSFVKYFDDE